MLRRHTTSPEDCYFAVWDGWGWDTSTSTVFVQIGDTAPSPPQPSDVRLDPDAPHFEVTHRGFHLYVGAVEQALTIGGGDYYANVGFFWEQSHTLMWPADHAWCLSTEIDAYTVIVGSNCLADDLTSSPGIEAVRVRPDEPPITSINQ